MHLRVLLLKQHHVGLPPPLKRSGFFPDPARVRTHHARNGALLLTKAYGTLTLPRHS